MQGATLFPINVAAICMKMTHVFLFKTSLMMVMIMTESDARPLYVADSTLVWKEMRSLPYISQVKTRKKKKTEETQRPRHGYLQLPRNKGTKGNLRVVKTAMIGYDGVSK